MACVEQSKRWHKASNDDILECLEEAMGDIEDALENMRGYEECCEWFDTLNEMWDEMEEKRRECEIVSAGDRQEMLDELHKEYLRGLL